MTLLEDICTYLTDLGLVRGAGEDTFLDFKPEMPDNIVSLHEYAGTPMTQFMPEAHRSVQVIVRNKRAVDAKSKAIELCKAFASPTEDRRIQFTPTRWGQVYVRQSPFKLEQDKSDRTHYCFNLGITTRLD